MLLADFKEKKAIKSFLKEKSEVNTYLKYYTILSGRIWDFFKDILLAQLNYYLYLLWNRANICRVT